MSDDIGQIIYEEFERLRQEYNLECSVREQELEEGYSMRFDPDNNRIIFDENRINIAFNYGKKFGYISSNDIYIHILFLLSHEIGHYHDHNENPNGFYVNSEEEYLQLEVNAWQKSKYMIPDDLKEEFDKFNLRIIDSYKHKFSKERENDS
ncbi:hypothetical protein [Paenibacillus polymyxa]|uniref:hypothetical protein n=1 Tax=Paenibacillus polymyxa TaxID=1406 RepID=UPI0007E928CC|nr:hypothetical protein [Paenibacillus polymyxa]OAZ48480.1 hypothetical protein A9Z39_14960 [Paenibacillus polymyxa]